MRRDNVLGLIGGTDHMRVNRLFGDRVEVWIKLERQNPAGSIKDRIALSMIEDAERRAVLGPNSVVIEPTSGNTGVALAMVCAVRGYPLILVMPESMSVERRKLMAAYGARFELTPRETGMPGAIARARELVAETPGAWMPMQFDNPANVEAHRRFTAQEIVDDFPEGLDCLVTGVGTGGHITACAQRLRAQFPGIQVFAVEPDDSPVLSGGDPGPHAIQGIGAGFVPSILDRSLLDGVVRITRDEAFRYSVRCAREEGLLVGISSGASLAAVAKTIPQLDAGSRLLTFCYDSGERYLSVPDLFEL